MTLVPAGALTREEWASRIRSRMAQTVEGIIAAGLDLIAAKNELPHGEFEAMVREDLGVSRQTAFRLMAVAGHPIAGNVAHAQHLPSSWYTLYELTKVENPILVQALDAGEIRPDMQRKDVKRLLATNGKHPAPPVVEIKAGTYSAIVADPPWKYDNRATRAAAEDHYPTMDLEDICAIPVEEWAAENAHLYLWVTNGFLREGFDVLEAWGFTYKTALTWVKPNIGIGNYFRPKTEHVLFGLRGKLPTQRNNISNIIEAKRGVHSRKPLPFYDLVNASSPGPYLEMFIRCRRDRELACSCSRCLYGWDAWGNES